MGTKIRGHKDAVFNLEDGISLAINLRTEGFVLGDIVKSAKPGEPVSIVGHGQSGPCQNIARPVLAVAAWNRAGAIAKRR